MAPMQDSDTGQLPENDEIRDISDESLGLIDATSDEYHPDTENPSSEGKFQ